MYKQKYLKYKKKYLDLKKSRHQKGGGYVLDDPEINNFTNIDLRDTLNTPATQGILDGTMAQQDVNKHLLTAIVTVDNRLKNKINTK
tara:strand:+ start:820 stop:1080 length:261 start_codon:yes stop_codon:yes gene_type:complete